MKKLTNIGLVLAAIVAVSPIANADNKASAKEAIDESRRAAVILAAIPELGDEVMTTSSTTSSMRCLVDTNKLDSWGSPTCRSWVFGSPFYTTAVFEIVNPPANFTINWSDSSCSQSSTQCVLPISFLTSPLSVSADVLDNSTQTFVHTSATANYLDRSL